jgi:hypothetical protein
MLYSDRTELFFCADKTWGLHLGGTEGLENYQYCPKHCPFLSQIFCAFCLYHTVCKKRRRKYVSSRIHITRDGRAWLLIYVNTIRPSLIPFCLSYAQNCTEPWWSFARNPGGVSAEPWWGTFCPPFFLPNCTEPWWGRFIVFSLPKRDLQLHGTLVGCRLLLPFICMCFSGAFFALECLIGPDKFQGRQNLPSGCQPIFPPTSLFLVDWCETQVFSDDLHLF